MRASARRPGEILHRNVGVSVALVLATALAIAMQAQSQTTMPLLLPSAIVFDARGDLYFADAGNHIVRELSAAGTITSVAGNGVQGFAGDGGAATDAELDSPSGLALDASGNLYIADSHNHRVREVMAATGTIRTVAGVDGAGFSGDGGLATVARLDLPTALAVDAVGNLYVADMDNHRVRRIAAGTGIITTFAGNGVEAFAGDGGVATAASIDSPNGLAVDFAGDLYLADTHNGRVRVVNGVTGFISTVAGVGGAQFFGGDDGPATTAVLALPQGLTMDAAGNLYVADSDNHRIRRISPVGVITTVAGQGAEAFAGDGAPAVAASLDTPRAVAISPGGLLTLADSKNQRVRQLDSLAAPGPDIHTLVGIGGGPISADALSLSGTSVATYGSGTLTATLTATTLGTGIVTLEEPGAWSATALSSASLSAGVASLSAAGLSAGTHSIVAVYPGDATHAAVQSSAFVITVTPLGLAATVDPTSILYGQPVPTLGGMLSGVLPQDAGKVSAVFTTTAAGLSPVGQYPITVMLAGSAAANYTVALTPASLTIAPAATQIALSSSSVNPSMGLPVTFTMQASSTTSGVPTGSVTLLDGTVMLAMEPLSTAGGATFTTNALTVGAHGLSAVYAGDTNFLPSTSAIANLIVGDASDFTLGSAGTTSQSVPAGSAATFNFSVAMQGAALASPITLAVQGIPLGATASLNPASLPPGSTSGTFRLTIQTPFARLDQRLQPGMPTSALLAGLLLPVIGLARRRLRRPAILMVLAAVSCVLLGTFATGCGNRINTASESVNAKTYTVTVTGTATSPAGTALQHSAVVTLEVL
jgi:sugar lactone lactonase YvrE